MQPAPVPTPGPPYAGAATAEEAVMTTLARLGRRMRQRLPGEELDLAGIWLMKTLRQRGPLRLSTLAAALEVDASTASRQVRHLEDRGLVKRSPDPDDGRANRIALSPAGRTRLDAGTERRRQLVADLLEGWPPEDRERLRVLLNRLIDELDHQETP